MRGWYAYAADLHVVHVLDVSDPAAPREVSSMWLTGNSTGIDDVMVVGGRAYVAGWERSASYPFTQSYSLVVFDVADPANPVWLGSCGLADTTTPMRLTVSGDRVYVGGSYLCIVDVADPAHPRLSSWGWSGASKAGSLWSRRAWPSRSRSPATERGTVSSRIRRLAAP